MTLNQVIRGGRKTPKKKIATKMLKIRGSNAPFMSMVVTKVTTTTPKKPNSAVRKIVKGYIKSKKGRHLVTVYVPDQSHTIQTHATVLVQGGGARDVPSAGQYSVMRGVHDAAAWKDRKNKRSKYGVSAPTKKK